MHHHRIFSVGIFLVLTPAVVTAGSPSTTMTSTHPNAQLIQSFYESFSRREPAGMTRCYAPDVHFSDEVFPDLHGSKVGSMWKMLCVRGTDLRIEASAIEANDTEGRAHWEAWYTFSATGKPVHNIIEARFTFQDGRIVRHVDSFDFKRWSKQALGVWGTFLGWTSFLKNKVRKQAAKSLEDFIRENP